jgi:hypothetical protein
MAGTKTSKIKFFVSMISADITKFPSGGDWLSPALFNPEKQ